MVVYRLAKTRYATDLTGEGSRLHGGRWNHIGTPCIYTSASRALAILEFTVNTNIADIPRTLSIAIFEIPDDDIGVVNVPALPGNWASYPAPNTTRTFGTKLLNAATNLIIQIPSVVIPEEFNYLLNPLHARASEFIITDIRDFVYDVRIKSV